MTNESYPDPDAVLMRDQAPEHSGSFWSELEGAMAAEPIAGTPTTTMLPGGSALVGEQTATLPGTVATKDELAARRDRRRMWPLAAAAAVIAVLGLGLLVTRSPSNPGESTDLVAGPTTQSDVVPLDGPQDDENADGEQPTSEAGEEDGEEAELPDSGDPDSGNSSNPNASGTTDPPPADELLLTLDPALGAVGDPDFLPRDGQLPDGSMFLANWPAAKLTWFAVESKQVTCADQAFSEIRFVNGSGITLDLSDPQIRFSGSPSHFTVSPGQDRAAWLVACGSQLELYVGSLQPGGVMTDIDLVWFGSGSAANALLLWDGDELNMNSIAPTGDPFAIAYEVGTEELTRNGIPGLLELEVGSPTERTSTPAAASADTTISYWPGTTPIGEGSCPGTFGRADTLWLRRVTEDAVPVWEPAVDDDTLLGEITAVAIEPEFSQVAFADVCPDENGRLFIATQRADGRLSNLREVDLSPFVPGFADSLVWLDSQTLRITTDNSNYGFGDVRFDFRLDDGRENGVIVQLD